MREGSWHTRKFAGAVVAVDAPVLVVVDVIVVVVGGGVHRVAASHIVRSGVTGDDCQAKPKQQWHGVVNIEKS